MTIAAIRAGLIDYAPSASVAPLNRLVGQLSGAIDALVGRVAEGWLDDLRSAWWPLEYVNANVLGDDRQKLTNAEVDAVATAREEFLALLEEY